MLDEDIAQKMKDEYPDITSTTDINTIQITFEKPSNTDLSSVKTEQNESDSESEHFENGKTSMFYFISYVIGVNLKRLHWPASTTVNSNLLDLLD